MSIPPRSLHTRISLLLTGLVASLLMVLAFLWVHGVRGIADADHASAVNLIELL